MARKRKKKKKERRKARATAPDTIPDAEGIVRQGARYRKEIEIRPIPLGAIPTERLGRLIEAQMNAHPYDGGAIDGAPPLLAFRLKDPAVSIHPELTFLAWVWEGFFGTSLTITFALRGAEPTFQSRVFLPQGSAVGARILRSRTFHAICIRRDHVEAAFEVVLPRLSGSPMPLADQETAYLDHTATFHDPRAHFWETLEGNWIPQFNATHHLSLSWMQAYRRYLRDLHHKAEWWSAQAPPRYRNSGDLPPILESILALLSQPSKLVASANKLFSSLLAEEAERTQFMRAVLELDADHDPDDYRASLAMRILAAHLWSSTVTLEGTRLPWLTSSNNEVTHIPLDAEALHARDAARDYWQRILALHGPLAIDWGLLIDGADVPISPDTLSTTIPSMRRVRDGSTRALYDDACRALASAAKLSENNVVERAVAPLSCGPLATAEFTQSGPEVLVVWRTADEEFAVFSVDPARGTWSTLQLEWLAQEVPKRDLERFEAYARLLISESIRDLRKTGESGLLDPSRWQASSIKVELDLIKLGPASRNGHQVASWVLRDTSPADTYVYMKGRFGEPNGMMSALRRGDSDNLFHWQYNISVEDELLAIMATSTRVECRAFTKAALSLADQHLLVVRLKNDFRNHGPAMKAVRRDLESWALFSNPYAQLTQTIQEAEQELLATPTREPPETPFVFADKEEADRVMKRRTEWLERVRGAFRLSMTIHVMAPIWGESFVNLVLLVLQGPDSRDDQRLYSDLLRRHIDIRVRDLHRYCVGFRRAADVNHSAFKDFLSLMNARNDTLHGNVDPTRLQVDSVLFDGTVPLFSEQRPLEARVLNQLFRPEYMREAFRAIKTVRAFTDYVLSCLEPRQAVEMRRMLLTNPLGYCKATRRFGILFGPMRDIAMIAETRDTSASAKKRTMKG